MPARKPRSASLRRPARVSEQIVRKNMDMDARKLRAARRILGATTDTETVDQALDLVVYKDEILGALDRLVDAGGLIEVFPDRVMPRGRRRRPTRG